MLAAGARLGPYEIVAPLGAGGMGEVYKARDSRLERVVAVKVISPVLAANPELQQRFEREARTISQLTHPNICALYDIGEAKPDPPGNVSSAVRFLVLEYCDGQTLAERLIKGPLPISQALKIGAEICDALHRAHSAGIVHRDLKPGNVMLTSAGAKLLDFGLARPGAGFMATGGVTRVAPTVSTPITTEGALIGTFQYMSPEQIEGSAPDIRSDIWAFGCVLYEMITGRRAFEGKSQTSVIAAILERQPEPLTMVQPEAPVLVDAIVRACLAKSPADRIQSAHDVGLQLEWLAQGSSASSTSLVLPPRRRRQLPWVVAGASIALAAALAVPAVRYIRGQSVVAPRAVVMSVAPPEGQSFTQADRFALSADGAALAFTTSDEERNRTLWVRRFDSPSPGRIAALHNPTMPFWSPNGESIGVFAEGALHIVTLASGTARRLVTTDGVSGTWSPSGMIAFSAIDGGIGVVRADGTGLRSVTARDASKGELGHLQPVFLPDGDRLLFTVDTRLTVNHPQELDIRVVSLQTGDVKSLNVAGRAVGYDDGWLLYTSAQDVLYAQQFDPDSLTVSGTARRVFQWENPKHVMVRYATASRAVAYRGGVSTSMHRLTWFDRAGKPLGYVGDPGNYSNPAISPDGRRLAVGVRAEDVLGRDLWIFDLTRNTSTKLTHDDGDDFNPVWSPDGSRIAFSSVRFGVRDLYVIPSSGLGKDELLLRTDIPKSAESWMPNGRFLLFSQSGKGPPDIMALKLDDLSVIKVLDGPFGEWGASFSPDGSLIAYQSDENGRQEVFIRTYPGTEGKWQISTSGGVEPIWRNDGRELFYLAGDDLMAVPITRGRSGSSAGLPRRLFSQRLGAILRNRYVVSPEGDRFLMNVPVTDRTTEPVTVVLNWRQLPQ